MENPLHGGTVDTAPPPPPRAGGRDAPQASAFAAVHARSMPAAPASPGALLRALGGGVPGAAAGVQVAQSQAYHLEPAVLIPTNMMGRVEGHAVDVNAVADLVKVERALVARSGAVTNGHGAEPRAVLLQGGASVVKQALGWDEGFMAKNLELGKLDGVDVEAVRMAVTALGHDEDDSEKVVDFCQKYLQLKGMGFQPSAVCGALVDSGGNIEAAIGQCVSL